MLLRLSNYLDRAFREGPDGTLEGNFKSEHPIFIHTSNAFYLSGCLAFLEGSNDKYSWNKQSPFYAKGDFDHFTQNNPSNRNNYASYGISKANMDALACIRNAVTHINSDLAKNDDSK